LRGQKKRKKKRKPLKWTNVQSKKGFDATKALLTLAAIRSEVVQVAIVDLEQGCQMALFVPKI
jgi:hypothetical protein